MTEPRDNEKGRHRRQGRDRRARGPATPRPVTAARLERAALDYLGRYASSAETLRRVLMRRVKRAALEPGEPAHDEALGWIAALIARLQRGGLLDDRAYAEGRAASLHRRGLARAAIGRRLGVKGVARDDVDAALATLQTSGEADGAAIDLRAALTLARRRRLGPYRMPAERAARRARDLAAMARAGFDYQTAQQVIDATDSAALEAELADGGC